MSSRKLTRSIISRRGHRGRGRSYAIVSSASSSPAVASSARGSAGGPDPAAGSNARSGPAAGGASGTIGSVSTSSFTLSTSAGQKVTVDEASSTTYQNGASSTSASAITKGEPVLVLGTTSGTTITATQVIVQPPSSGIFDFLGRKGDPLPARCTDHVKARSVRSRRATLRGQGRSSAEQQRIRRRKLRWPPTRGHRRPCCEAEQRRVRGPLHRRQLAAPRLRQPGLQGHRRRLGRPRRFLSLLPIAANSARRPERMARVVVRRGRRRCLAGPR